MGVMRDGGDKSGLHGGDLPGAAGRDPQGAQEGERGRGSIGEAIVLVNTMVGIVFESVDEPGESGA